MQILRLYKNFLINYNVYVFVKTLCIKYKIDLPTLLKSNCTNVLSTLIKYYQDNYYGNNYYYEDISLLRSLDKLWLLEIVDSNITSINLKVYAATVFNKKYASSEGYWETKVENGRIYVNKKDAKINIEELISKYY